MDKLSLLYFLTFTVSCLTSSISTAILIPPLSKLAKQPIYTEGPSWHSKKCGTPTMGGLSMLIGSASAILLIIPIAFNSLYTRDFISILLTLVFAMVNGLVGITDDLIKLKKKHNAGLTPLQKILIQTAFAAIFLYFRHVLLGDKTSLYLFGYSIELGPLYYVLCVFILLGIINCANLTDGIDGLASSVSFSIGFSLFLICVGVSLGGTLTSLILAGVSLSFLFFNIHPAKIFMGDTGSLFLGGLVAGICFVLNKPILSIPLSAVYVVEGFSVILQVFFYKLKKKRIFKMAPIHHHLEQCGMSEAKICMIAMLLTFSTALLTVIIGL